MTRSDSKRLNDIRRMCADAAELVRRGRPALETDPLLWHAMERIVEVAGEAATQLSERTRDQYANVPWPELIAVRVVLAHAYHRVDLELLWNIASIELPKVAQELGPLEPGSQEGQAERPVS